jgi:hypothetical protein
MAKNNNAVKPDTVLLPVCNDEIPLKSGLAIFTRKASKFK